MIGKSIPELIFIRTAILGFQLIAPASLLYLAWAIAVTHAYDEPSALEFCLLTWAFIEAAFLLCVYLPRHYRLQKAADHPPHGSRTERQVLFQRCSEYLGNTNYPRGWFRGSGFRRNNVTEWLLWAMFSSPGPTWLEEWEDELMEYVTAVENVLGRELQAGYNKDTPCMRPTLDSVSMVHRPLLWYMIVCLIDFLTCLKLYSLGFRHYSDTRWFQSFPPRPWTILSKPSNAVGLSFWYRPHRSHTKLPVLFLHGIGIGIFPYLAFLGDLTSRHPNTGVLIPEFLSISSRITSPPLSRTATVTAIRSILDALSLGRVVVASHSYGTVVTAHIFRSPEVAPRVAATLFVDPIPFLLHLPDVAYNFMYRSPRTANEWLIWYFASRDPDVSRTLARHFFWSENTLWKEDLDGKAVAVTLGGQDQVVNSEAVRRYLTGEDKMEEYWQGGGLEVLYHPELDHAMVFHTKKRRRLLIDVLDRFIRMAQVRN
ncbi:hypothetical protein PAXINDRAFT_166994 [Paxillus involutus ATCC 200175]|nr:hypothetical protein PAXINDRAFT_166994 [Paxillus involutus ATCC 200175]